MKSTPRLYSCALCHIQVVICSCCDRGQIYCSKNCSSSVRKKSMLEAGQRYQKTYQGKLKHALRQANYRARLRKKVTHQGSPPLVYDVLLRSAENKAVEKILEHEQEEAICHFCKKIVSTYFRTDFLQQRWRVKEPSIRLNSQPP